MNPRAGVSGTGEAYCRHLWTHRLLSPSCRLSAKPRHSTRLTIAGAVILASGFTRADGIASLIIAAIMLRAAYGLLRGSGRVLLEAAPEGMSVAEIGAALTAQPHVESIHDLHVWSVGSDLPALSAHVPVHPGDDCHAIRRELEALLDNRFGVTHTTLQVDHAGSERLLTIGVSRDPD